MRIAFLSAFAGSLVLGLLVAGCAGSPTTNFYTLSSIAPSQGTAAPLRDTATVVAIGPVTLPDYVDRPQIVTRDSAYAVKVAPFDQWAGPLADMLPRVLIEDVARALPGDRVAGFPQVDGSGFDYRIAVDITRFDVDKGGTATLVARWQIYDRAARRAGLIADETLTRPSAGDTYEAHVAALSGSLADLAGRLAESVTLVRATPARPALR